MAKTIYQIYDKMFKKILTLSSTAVINLINGLFETDYAPDSTITYNWTEFEDNELRKTLADTIITINNLHSYHLEAQVSIDENIIFRVFDYGYSHAQRNFQDEFHSYTLHFPEPKIIYLYAEADIPDTYTLTLVFGTQGTFEYKVPTMNYQKITTEELNQRKMIILIPFSLLKLRNALEKERSPENLAQLQTLIQNDIIYSIDNNLRVGNITMDDARKLRSLTHKLYSHLYAHYEEMEELNEMTDESLLLDIEILEKKYEQEIENIEKKHKREIENVEKKHEQEITSLTEDLIRQQEEIAQLKKQLAAVKKLP